jgi:starch synthase
MSQCGLHILGVEPADRGHSAAFLANAAAAMVRDEICRPDAIIAWGESGAAVLPAVPANVRVFALPSGTWGPPLSAEERAALNCDAPDLAIAQGSLAGLGAVDADVVVFPSPSSARRFETAREFSFRASDQAVVAVRLGCDEAPHDPATDPALAASYSPASPAGKAECRRALARRTSLALGRRTLLLATAPLAVADGGRRIIDAIGRLVRSDVALVIPALGERSLVDEVKRIAIETPGKIAVYPDSVPEAERQILAGADAVLLADKDNHLARTAGLAMRYGTLPLAPDCAAYHDYIVDYDVATRTGHGLLYMADDAYEHVSVVLRCASLRSNPDVWRPLQQSLMQAAPRWASTAAQLEELCLSPRASA